MNLIIVIAAAIAVSSASILEDPLERNNNENDGTTHLDYAETALFADADDNEYDLYTRDNPLFAQVLTWRDSGSIQNSNFNGSKDTVIITHGWNGYEGNDNTVLLTEAFLEDNDVNVIVLDWSKVADGLYVIARRRVPAIGRRLGEFILWMTNFGLSYERLHLVGFSLGGHVVGFAGRAIGGNVKRITALDPAGPLFYVSDGLTSTDALYVEVIHTSANFGYQPTCGDADFYPNGGAIQPGCLLPACSHGMSYRLMAASIKYKHLFANKCTGHIQALADRCTGELYAMGNSDLNKTGTGVFRVDTETDYPYKALD